MLITSASGTKLNYRWQVSYNNGYSWNVLTDGGTSPAFSGSFNDTLIVTNIPQGEYKFRCVVINACGTEKTDEAFVDAFICGNPFYDGRNGLSYNTLQVGSQCWMADNLNYIPETVYGLTWCYDNNPANCESYGRLYNWFAAMQGATTTEAVPSGIKGICPDGWHLPSSAEFAGDIGGSLAGFCDSYYSQFVGIGTSVNFWSTTEKDGATFKAWFLEDNYDLSYDLKEDGYSVRCVKD